MKRLLLALVLGFMAWTASIVASNLLIAQERRAQKRTMGDMRTVATACESYSIHNNAYPVATGLAPILPLLEPTYVKKLPLHDGWGRPFAYVSDGKQYVVSSRGSDGLWANPSLPRSPSGAFDGTPPSLVEMVRRRMTGATAAD